MKGTLTIISTITMTVRPIDYYRLFESNLPVIG